MSVNIKHLYILISFIIFILIPIIFFILGDTPSRTVLKNCISILTVLSFFIMIGQFFLSKINESLKNIFKLSVIIKIHKIAGYIFLPILILHPFLVVVPRYFEVGVSPLSSFIKMITGFDSLGVILGIIAWLLMLCLGVTSIFKDSLNISYKTWRVFHGFLSFLFIIFASWHSIDIGRHMDLPMSVLINILIISTTGLFIKNLFKKNQTKLKGTI